MLLDTFFVTFIGFTFSLDAVLTFTIIPLGNGWAEGTEEG